MSGVTEQTSRTGSSRCALRGTGMLDMQMGSETEEENAPLSSRHTDVHLHREVKEEKVSVSALLRGGERVEGEG